MRKVLLLALLLCGCGIRSETSMLDDRTAIIGARGSFNKTTGAVTKAALQEAATQAKARGFAYFTITSVADRTVIASVGSTGPTIASGTYGSGTFNAMSQPGGTVTTPVPLPGTDLMVRFYKAGEIDPAQPGVWNANTVLDVK